MANPKHKRTKVYERPPLSHASLEKRKSRPSPHLAKHSNRQSGAAERGPTKERHQSQAEEPKKSQGFVIASAEKQKKPGRAGSRPRTFVVHPPDCATGNGTEEKPRHRTASWISPPDAPSWAVQLFCSTVIPPKDAAERRQRPHWADHETAAAAARHAEMPGRKPPRHFGEQKEEHPSVQVGWPVG